MKNKAYTSQDEAAAKGAAAASGRAGAPDYSACPSGPLQHAVALLTGFAIGFAVAFIFYKVLALSIACGAGAAVYNFVSASRSAIRKRIVKLRFQFFDLLESMSVAMRAGNALVRALQSARDDLLLIYHEDSDIVVELDIILGKFNNAVPLSEAFADFAQRSGLEDISGFATVYATIEGKSSKADEIIRDTQQIIADKMEIELEIETLMTSAKTEANIMLLMPLVILAVIGYTGAGFMDAIYTTPAGRVVATIGLAVYAVSFALARKFSNVPL